jgi:hypothetical protein
MQQTAAVLDEMVAGIMGVKAEKATKLTPVGFEGVTFTPEANKFAPMESPYSGVLEACRRIRESMTMLEKYVAAIERDATFGPQVKSIGQPRDALEDAMDEALAVLDEPVEETLAARMVRLEAEAQSAAFGAPAKAGWTCSAHGDTDVREHTSPRGRRFMACEVPGCKEFEKA